MSGGRSNRETEIKLAIGSAADGRRMLKAAGFRVSRARVFESNTVFDTAEKQLRRGGGVLRVRSAGRKFTLTYKSRGAAGKHKSREELEVTLPEADTVTCIFGKLRFRPVFRYDKYRTEFEQTGGGGTATLDETPIGCFLEMEGAPAWIDRTATRLGFTEADYDTRSYGALYLAWCRRNHKRPADMVFSARQRRETGGK